MFTNVLSDCLYEKRDGIKCGMGQFLSRLYRLLTSEKWDGIKDGTGRILFQLYGKNNAE